VPASDHPASLARRAVAAADPRDRLRAIAALRGELDALEADAVRAALDEGASWAHVAAALGITKQSAHRRHAERLAEPPRERPPVDDGGGRMVVTAQARQAVRAARAAARALEHAAVDPGHLLLGLMTDEDGSAAAALSAIGVDFDAVRDAVGRLGLPATPAGEPARRPVPISPAARAALEHSLREAQRLGHEHLGVEHLLLALLHDADSGAVRALADVKVSLDDLERCLGKLLKEAPFASA
jgi:transposase-like protein